MSLLALLLSFTSCLCLVSCQAFNSDIKIDTTVPAGKPIEATIVNQNLYDGDTLLVTAIRVHLAAAATSSHISFRPDFLQAQCTLTKALSLCNKSVTIYPDHVSFPDTTFAITIPDNVGPSGLNYALYAQIFQTDGQRYGAEISSNIFNLTGATGNWSQDQLQDYTFWSADSVPCSSFACVKECADRVWGKENTTDVYENCAGRCAGVSADFTADGSAAMSVSTSTSTPATCPAYTSASTSSTSVLGFTATSSVPTSSSPTSASAAALHFSRAWITTTGLFVSMSAYLILWR